MQMTTVTEELIEQGKSSNGGWSMGQLALLGVPWPPQRGWKAQVIGKTIRSEDAAEFARLKDQHLASVADNP